MTQVGVVLVAWVVYEVKIIMKLSSSDVHKYKNLVFFSGSIKNELPSLYLYKESNLLFTAENLASHLAEYSYLEECAFDPNKNQSLFEFYSAVDSLGYGKVNIIDVRLYQGKKFKIELQHFDQIARKVLDHALNSEGGFEVSLESNEKIKDPVMVGIPEDRYRYLRLYLPMSCVNAESQQLSERFRDGFYSKWNADINVFFFLLMVSLPLERLRLEE